MDWKPISEVRFTRYGTVADLKMRSGRVYRSVWGFRGRCCAWWPIEGRRERPIGLYEPVEFRIVAEGILPSDRWEDAVSIGHAAA